MGREIADDCASLDSDATNTADESHRRCRMCLSGDEDGELLADVCACRGTQRFLHRHCLNQWRSCCLSAGRLSAWQRCGVCQVEFRGDAFEPLSATAGHVIPRLSVLVAVASLLLAGITNVILPEIVSPLLNEDDPCDFMFSWETKTQSWSDGFAYVRAVAGCVPRRPITGVWHGIVQRRGKQTCILAKAGITGAQLFTIGQDMGVATDVFLHGGWDDCNGARAALLTAPLDNLVADGADAWAEVFVEKGSPDCPGSVYCHTATVLPGAGNATSNATLVLVVGGHTAGGYRMVSSRWGIFEIWRSEDRSWRAAWRVCSGALFASRAWHTATFLPGRGEALLCGGAHRGSDFFATRFDVNAALAGSTAPERSLEPGPCRRQGHSAVLVGDAVYVFGGSDYLGPGMPWHGRDLEDVTPLDAANMSWRPTTALNTPTGNGEVTLRRQHTATLLPKRSGDDSGDSILFYGGGYGGLSNATLLSLDGEGGVSDVLPLEFAPLPGCNAAEESPPHINTFGRPALRGHAVAWTGRELLVVGGAASECQGYFGMMVLRPTY